MKAPFLELRGIAKSFGRSRALDGVDLDVGAGELVAVLGPTGAGKTTLLRVIAGLVAPDAGTLRIDGADATRLAPAERDVALVFQNFSLYPGRSVRANLEFPLRAPGRGLSAEQIRERVEWAAELLRIPHLLERESRHLSGGEMQRVAIGRAIVRRPRLFLMDEPLSNLDAKLRESLRVELKSLARELETPMVYVTHDQAEALSISERIVVLHAGKVLQSGAPSELYLRPSSPLVARQLGQPPINTFRARGEHGWWLADDGTKLARADDASGVALLGVRPEHIDAFGGESTGTVEIVEDTGPACIVLVRWGSMHVHLLSQRKLDLRPGDELRPRIDPARVVVWRGESA